MIFDQYMAHTLENFDNFEDYRQHRVDYFYHSSRTYCRDYLELCMKNQYDYSTSNDLSIIWTRSGFEACVADVERFSTLTWEEFYYDMKREVLCDPTDIFKKNVLLTTIRMRRS